jgi:hypothetical protein
MFTLSLGYASRRRISGFNIEVVVNFKFSRPPAMLALALLLSSFFQIVGVPRTWSSPSSHPVRDWGMFFKDSSENCVIITNYLLSVFRMPLQQLLALVGNIVPEMLNLQLKKVYDRTINGGMDIGSHEASPQ